MNELAIDVCEPLDARLKRVLRFTPAPVAIVSSYDPSTGMPVGLAISAIMPVSLDPCAMAVAINRSASAYATIRKARKFCINLLDPERSEHMLPFSSHKEKDRRFIHSDWKKAENIWYIESSPANIFCDVQKVLSYGTHDILVGKVYELKSKDSNEILAWANGSLCQVSPL